MHADALQHQPLAVEKKALMGKLRPANAERRGITLHNPVAATYRRDGDIPIRMSGPPEPGIIHGKLLYEQLPVLHAVDDIFSPGQYLSRACTVGAERKQLGRHDRSRHLHPVVTQLLSLIHILADAELRAGWTDRARRHHVSAIRAAEDLRLRLDDIETEGDMTFEDGMITCSALQMALCGLHMPDGALRRQYAEAARHMMEKHRCLEQRLIPDCRMRGATLRYWEALDIYFSPNQAMNSPHGWTAWKIYAVCYLYLLTGEEHYLDELMETTGACVQLMDLDGRLRWGFIPDPYICLLYTSRCR